MKIYCRILPVLLLFAGGCKKSNGGNGGDNANGGGNVNNSSFMGNQVQGTITEFINGGDNGIMRGNCSNAHILFYPAGNTRVNSAYNTLVLEGNKLPQSHGGLQIVLFYRGILRLNSAFILEHPSNSPDSGQRGYGIIAENSLPGISYGATQWESYYTASTPGQLIFTSYDPTNENVSGTYQFSAMQFTGGQLSSGAARVWSGTFTTVPITDQTDPNKPKGPCYNIVGAKLN